MSSDGEDMIIIFQFSKYNIWSPTISGNISLSYRKFNKYPFIGSTLRQNVQLNNWSPDSPPPRTPRDDKPLNINNWELIELSQY